MNRAKAQVVEGLVSVIVNIVLFGIKFWAGIVTGSIAIIADAWHTLSDSLTSVIVIIAAKLSAKKADKEHPFGHGRWEQISSIFVAVILGIIAVDFMKDSIVRLYNKETVKYGILAITITVVSILVKELLAQFAFYIGRMTNNIIVRADGWHHRFDAFSSVVVLAGILCSLFMGEKVWWIDSVLGIFIAMLLFYVTFMILKESITVLLGEEPDKEIAENISTYIKSIYRDDLQLHHFHVHNYVTHKELTMHIRLDKTLTIEKSHKIASDLENMINAEFGIIATIHTEPLYW